MTNSRLPRIAGNKGGRNGSRTPRRLSLGQWSPGAARRGATAQYTVAWYGIALGHQARVRSRKPHGASGRLTTDRHLIGTKTSAMPSSGQSSSSPSNAATQAARLLSLRPPNDGGAVGGQIPSVQQTCRAVPQYSTPKRYREGTGQFGIRKNSCCSHKLQMVTIVGRQLPCRWLWLQAHRVEECSGE